MDHILISKSSHWQVSTHDCLQTCNFSYIFPALTKKIAITVIVREECNQWVKALEYLIPDTVRSPYPLRLNTWLRKEFYNMNCER